jgi:N4-gp56 family major capsid protein
MPYTQFAPQGSQFNNQKAAVFIPEIWSRDVIRKRDESLIMYPFVSRIDFRGQKGDTIYLPFISNMGVNNKVAGSPVTYQSFEENRWQMVVNRYKEVSFAIDKLTEIQAQNDLRSIYTERAGFAMARDIEYSILAERATINGYNSGSNVLTSGAPLDYTDILAACEILQLANVPMSNWRLVVSPKQHNSLLTQEEFISSDYSSTKSVETGKVGSVLGVPVYVTTSITTNSATGFQNGDNAATSPTSGMANSLYFPTQSPRLRDGTSVTASGLTSGYDTAILCHPDWCKLAMVKMPNIDYEWSVDYQEHHIVQTQIFDCEVFRPDHAVLINTTE